MKVDSDSSGFVLYQLSTLSHTHPTMNQNEPPSQQSSLSHRESSDCDRSLKRAEKPNTCDPSLQIHWLKLLAMRVVETIRAKMNHPSKPGAGQTEPRAAENGSGPKNPQ